MSTVTSINSWKNQTTTQNNVLANIALVFWNPLKSGDSTLTELGFEPTTSKVFWTILWPLSDVTAFTLIYSLAY